VLFYYDQVIGYVPLYGQGWVQITYVIERLNS